MKSRERKNHIYKDGREQEDVVKDKKIVNRDQGFLLDEETSIDLIVYHMRVYSGLGKE